MCPSLMAPGIWSRPHPRAQCPHSILFTCPSLPLHLWFWSGIPGPTASTSPKNSWKCKFWGPSLELLDQRVWERGPGPARQATEYQLKPDHLNPPPAPPQGQVPGLILICISSPKTASGPCSSCFMLSRFSRIWLCTIPRTAARQAPLSMGFSRQEYWSGLPCPPPGDLPYPGIKPMSVTSNLHWQAGSLPVAPPGKSGPC